MMERFGWMLSCQASDDEALIIASNAVMTLADGIVAGLGCRAQESRSGRSSGAITRA